MDWMPNFCRRRKRHNELSLDQRSRNLSQWPTLESIAGDVRFALRQLRKSPGFTTAAVLTLALAIGANAVVFGIMDGLVLRPLNVEQSESLYGTHYGDNLAWQSYPNYIDLRDRNRSFEDLAAFNMVLGVGFNAGKDPVAANGFATTGNYFDVLRIHPYLGRLFHASDEHGPNSAPYVVLTYAYWHSRFHDDQNVIGRIVQLDKHPFTIIGVAPPKFQGTILFLAPDFFMPIVNEEQTGAPSLSTRATEHGVFEALGHLKPGVTTAQAMTDVDGVTGYLEKAYPRQIVHHGTELSREGLTAFGPAVRAFVAGLMVLSGLILLAACANLGSLFAARAADRSREVALRLALGSSRKRILRGLLVEALLISLTGGAAGLLVSFMLLRRMSIGSPFPRFRSTCRSPPTQCSPWLLWVWLWPADSYSALCRYARSSAPTRTRSSRRGRTPGLAAGSRSAMCSSSRKLQSAPCWSRLRWWPCAGLYARCTANWVSIRTTR